MADVIRSLQPYRTYAPTVTVTGQKAKRLRTKRRPSLANAARVAAKEGVEVKYATDGTITVTPVKPIGITNENPWDEVLTHATH